MQDNIAIVKEMYAAFGRGDLAAIQSRLTDDVVWEAEGPASLGFCGIRRGREEAMTFFAALGREHANADLQMTEFFSNGDNVAAFGRYSATMAGSGQRASTPVAHLFRLRDGKVAHYVNVVNTAAFVDAMANAAGAGR